MRYVSHLACTICGTTFSAETPMNRCPHDGRPIQVMRISIASRPRADATAGGTRPGPTRPLAVRGTASSRYQRRGRFPLDRHPGRGMHAVARVCSSAARPRRFSSRGQGRGAVSSRFRCQSHALFQGSRDVANRANRAPRCEIAQFAT